MVGKLTSQTRRHVLVTGPSGAGRTTAIRILEDFGHEAIDNLPLSLLPGLVKGSKPEKPMALGIDPRNRDFSTSGMIETIDELGSALQVLYMDCSADVLIRRFSETRRRHPLAPVERPYAGIQRELELLAPVRELADILVDTSELSPNDLRGELEWWFVSTAKGLLAVSAHSFSYKRGLPKGLDIVLDCRFLKNPHWNDELQELDGRNPRVMEYVKSDRYFDRFICKVMELAGLLLPAYQESGKSYLAIGLGCTGGRHRSVAIAEILAKALEEEGWPVSIRHRELESREKAVPESAAPGNPGFSRKEH
ncbi:MAG: RNase adapter RapZ [Roseovarius sp.]|nr:RNase adapter RapZ [Roseovarius sp.]MCY4208045.1 RNase adapter RapZ [Roseovarius sp.]MCY4292730.1 RNase adapter RapZ [Roseovarius sp.]